MTNDKFTYVGGKFLPAVGGAVTTVEGVFLGILQGVEDNLVLGVEVNIQQLVDFVEHLGGKGVFGGGFGVVASGLLDARQLGVVTSCVHHEAHASGEVSLADRRAVLGGTGGAADGEKTETEDDGLQDQKDEQVGEVEGQDLGRRRGSGQKFQSCADEGGILLGVSAGQHGSHNGGSV